MYQLTQANIGKNESQDSIFFFYHFALEKRESMENISSHTDIWVICHQGLLSVSGAFTLAHRFSLAILGIAGPSLLLPCTFDLCSIMFSHHHNCSGLLKFRFQKSNTRKKCTMWIMIIKLQRYIHRWPDYLKNSTENSTKTNSNYLIHRHEC